jgi:hypothetical protein
MAMRKKFKDIDPSRMARIRWKDSMSLIQFTDAKGRRTWSEATHQISMHKLQMIDTVINATSVPTNILESGGTVSFKITKNDIVVQGCTLEINVVESGSSNPVRPTIAPLMIGSIEWWANGGGQKIMTTHGEQLLFDIGMALDDGDLESAAKVLNMNSHFQQPNDIPAGGSARYYIPIISSPLSSKRGIYLGNLAGDLICRIHFVPSKESGSGTLAVNNNDMHLHLHTLELPEDDIEDLRRDFKGKDMNLRVLEAHPQSWEGETLAASTEFKRELSGMTNVDAVWTITAIRSGNSNTSGARRTFVDLGDTAQYTLLDQSSNDLYGGSQLEYGLVRYLETPKYYSGTLFREKPLIPFFFSDPRDYFAADVTTGSFHFTSKEHLRIVPAAAAVNCVLTLTPSGTAVSGSWRIFFRDPITGESGMTDPLAYNANAAAIKAAIEGTAACRGTVTANQALSSGAVTLTFSGLYAGVDFHKDDVAAFGSNLLTSGPADVTITTSKTTAGVSGFVGGTYNVDFYAYRLKHIVYKADGKIEVHQE